MPTLIVEIKNNMDTRNLEIEELLASIGSDLSVHQALPLNKKQLVEKGRRWFEANLKKFRATICNSVAAEHIINASDEATLIASISDLIAGLCVGVSPVTVATILVKLGLKNLCNHSEIDDVKS